MNDDGVRDDAGPSDTPDPNEHALVNDHPGMSDAEQERRRHSIAELFPTTPFMSWLGIVFERYEHDDVVIRLPFREELTNDGTYYHGGVISSVIDSVGAAAAWSFHDFDRGTRASTVGMTVNFVGACRQADLVCRATTVKRAKELIFTEITAYEGSLDAKVVAHAIQTYRIA